MGICFNPCFGGSYIVTINIINTGHVETPGFNPCFGGSYIVTIDIKNITKE